jgi:ferredoxin/flavodoxin---NADP+ reductase
MSATEFVAWYNGHPDFRELKPDLSRSRAWLSWAWATSPWTSRASSPSSHDELKATDIADHALEVLKDSRVTDIYVLGRRGPAQAKFTNPEIREFGKLEDAEPVVLPRRA